MASYRRDQQGGGAAAPAAAPAPAAPTGGLGGGGAPSDLPFNGAFSGGGGGGGHGGGYGNIPTNQGYGNIDRGTPNYGNTDSPVGNVANFSGNVNAHSGGGPSPFGTAPDLSQADPATLARLLAGTQGIEYAGIAEGPGGGYRYGQTFQPGTQKIVNHYIGAPPKNDPIADRAMSQYYQYIGGLPQQNVGTGALAAFNAAHGTAPAANQPSMNQRSEAVGMGPWQGPWEFPGWHLGG